MAVDADGVDAGRAYEVLVALLPILLGGASSYFQVFIESPKEFRARVSLTRQRLQEGVNERLQVLLRGVVDLSTGTDIVLRGDGMHAPDLVGDLTEEQHRSFSLLHRISTTERLLKAGHFVLLLTTMGGVVVLLLALLVTSLRSLLVYAATVLVLAQVLTIVLANLYSRRLDDFEDFS